MSRLNAKAARTPQVSSTKDDAEEHLGMLRTDGGLVVVCIRAEFCPPGNQAGAL